MATSSDPGRDAGALQPVTVWAVRLAKGDTRERRGTLSLEDGFLKFAHAKGTEDVEIPLTAVRKVKRSLGSPCLVVEYRSPEGVGALAFFFSRPPPVQAPSMVGRGRRQKRESVTYLMGENAVLRDDVKRWRDALRSAVRAAR